MQTTNRGETTTVEPTRAQGVIARRVAESRATIPSFELTTSVVLGHADADVGARAVLACGRALREHPRVNGAWKDGAFDEHGRVNVGVVVAGPDALVVPVISDADEKALDVIARELSELVAKARAGTTEPRDVSGATFTLLDLSAEGVDAVGPLITPGHAAALTVGAVAERPVARDGAIVAARTATLTLACDHRILYPTDATAFLRRVGELVSA